SSSTHRCDPVTSYSSDPMAPSATRIARFSRSLKSSIRIVSPHHVHVLCRPQTSKYSIRRAHPHPPLPADRNTIHPRRHLAFPFGKSPPVHTPRQSPRLPQYPLLTIPHWHSLTMACPVPSNATK